MIAVSHSIQTVLSKAKQDLNPITDQGLMEAEILLSSVLHRNRASIRTSPDIILSNHNINSFRLLINRRQHGEPLAYILGCQQFWSLELMVTEETLIPRPETELLVELALEKIPLDAYYRALDLGTGSGAIALAIAKERPLCQVVAIDKFIKALHIASQNVKLHNIKNIDLCAGDWLLPFKNGRFNMIISNPPYVAAQDPHLLGEIRFEPYTALVSGPTGYEAIEYIINHVKNALQFGGWLLLEHGYDQSERVLELFLQKGFSSVSSHQDLSLHDRVVVGQNQ